MRVKRAYNRTNHSRGPSKWYIFNQLPATGWLSYESLSKKRADLIQHEIIGNRDGRTALDYTVNAKSWDFLLIYRSQK